MKDPNLLNSTASESLTLNEEMSMQSNWHEDSNKCIFLISKSQTNFMYPLTCPWTSKTIEEESQSLIGDVNLFLQPFTPGSNQSMNQSMNHSNDSTTQRTLDSELKIKTAEIDIMIAHSCHRGLGLGKDALHMMMAFGIHFLSIQKFVAKISDSNPSSLSLFRKMNFQISNSMTRPNIFGEWELEFRVTLEAKEKFALGVQKEYSFT